MHDLYLTRGTTPARLASLFRSAERLWRAAPWRIMLADDCLISVHSDALELNDAVISVVGQHRSIFGFMVFPGGVRDFSEFERRAATGRMAVLGSPPNISLTFVERSEMSPRARREVELHRWALPASSIYPVFTACNRFDVRGAPPHELSILEAVALGLAELVDVEPQLSDATFGLSSFDRTIGVATHDGERSIRFRAPCVPPPLDDPADDCNGAGFDASKTTAGWVPAGTAATAEERRRLRNRRKADRRAQR
jgi:hypothetical protein